MHPTCKILSRNTWDQCNYIDVNSIDKNNIPDTLNGAIVIGNQMSYLMIVFK